MRIYGRLLGKDFKTQDIARLFPKFMEFEPKTGQFECCFNLATYI